MRTTIDIDDDVFLAVGELARREDKSAGELITALVREALQARARGVEAAKPDSFYGFRPFPRRGAVVDNALIDRLRNAED